MSDGPHHGLDRTHGSQSGRKIRKSVYLTGVFIRLIDSSHRTDRRASPSPSRLVPAVEGQVIYELPE
jgi:hypothetical protein